MTERYPFEPDYAVPPGETLKETMDAMCVTNHQMAKRLGLTDLRLRRIITGHEPIDAVVVYRLEWVTGIPSKFWEQRESTYRKSLK